MLPLLAGFLGGSLWGTYGAAGLGALTGALNNKDDPITGALMGGLSGYGAGNLGSALSNMGAAAGATTPATAAIPTINEAVVQELGSAVNTTSAPGIFTPKVGGYDLGSASLDAITPEATYNTNLVAPISPNYGVDLSNYMWDAGTSTYTQPLTFTQKLSNIGGGLRSLTSEGGWDRFKTALGGAEGPASNMKAGLALGMPAVSVASSLGAFDQPQPATAPFVEEEDKYTRDGGLFLYGPKSLNSGLKLYNVGGMVDTQNYPARYTNPETENYQYGLGRLSSLAASQAQANAEANRFAEGGVPTLQDGGFVVPADVVFYMGGHDTAEGQARLAEKYGAMPIRGPGNGLDDSIDTTIEGREPAKIADGEAYIPREVVAKHGGPEKFYKMMDKVRKQATGTTRQAKRATV